MRNSKHGLKSVALAIMATALGMMAFAATGAQATEPGLNPEPLLEPKNLPGKFSVGVVAFPASVTGEGKLGSLLVPTRDLKLECHITDVEEGTINNSTEGLGKVKFLNCVSLSISSGEKLPCTLTTEDQSVSAKTVVLALLHGPEGKEENFVLFEPHKNKEGVEEPFTTVSYKSGTECPLPLNNQVRGGVSALVEVLEAVKQLILFSPGIQLLTGDKLRFGLNPAYIDADATLFLTGGHTGQNLGVH